MYMCHSKHKIRKSLENNLELSGIEFVCFANKEAPLYLRSLHRNVLQAKLCRYKSSLPNPESTAGNPQKEGLAEVWLSPKRKAKPKQGIGTGAHQEQRQHNCGQAPQRYKKNLHTHFCSFIASIPGALFQRPTAEGRLSNTHKSSPFKSQLKN